MINLIISELSVFALGLVIGSLAYVKPHKKKVNDEVTHHHYH